MRKIRYGALLLLIGSLAVIYLVRLHSSYNNASSRSTVNFDFTDFNNTGAGSSKLLVPNIIHYIVFDKSDIEFVMFVCMLSAWLNHRPSKVMLHSNVEIDSTSKYMTVLKSVMGSSLKLEDLKKPSHVFGVKLAIVHHSSDVARLQVLRKYGGIYLDWDVYVVKNLNPYRHYECVIGWPEGAFIGNQVIMAHKNSRFLRLWQQSYRDYHPTEWYYNGGEVPTKKILIPRPELVHRAKWEFGVEALTDKLYQSVWSDYADRYTIHLLASHKYLHGKAKLTEEEYNSCNCTFATLVNSVLTQLQKDQQAKFNMVTAANQDLGAATSQQNRIVNEYEQMSHFLKHESKSLLRKHLTPTLLDQLRSVKTGSYKSTLYDVVKTSLVNPDSSVGLFAPDVESYKVFKSLFMPIIKEYHNLPEGFSGQPAKTWGDLSKIGKFGNEVISTRIRIARSIAGFPLNSKMTRDHLFDLEEMVKNALTENFDGTYHSLPEMSEETRKDLVQRHFLFEDCDRFTEGGGGCTHWPEGRGIFLSSDQKFLVWVNEEDHLRIISMDKGGDLHAIYNRLVESMNKLEKNLNFSHDPYLGFLTFCPSNLGTTLRASVHLKFNNLNINQVKKEAKMMGLQVRGTHGEHSDVKGGVMDISNSRRLGLTEFQAINQVYTGVNKLLKKDRKMN